MEQHQLVEKWCQENPYLVYADYRDELSSELKAQLLGVKTQIDFELWLDCWHAAYDEQCWIHRDSAHFREMLQDTGRGQLLNEGTFVAAYQLDQLFEIYRDNLIVDTDPFLLQLLRTTQVQVAAELLDETGEPLRSLQGDEDKGFAAIKAALPDASPDDFHDESSYNCTIKALGTISLLELYEKQRAPDKVILPLDTLIVAHDSASGYGFEVGEIKSMSSPVRCRLIYDEADRYGVQKTFGFCGYIWKKELDPFWD